MIGKEIESQIKFQGELNLGKRKIFKSRYTSLVSLPKAFVENCLGKEMIVQLTLLGDGSLKITAVPTEDIT